MEFRIFDINRNRKLTEQKRDIIEDILGTTCFNFPCTPVANEISSGFTQLNYISGYVDLFDHFGKYTDKMPSDFAVITGLPTDDRESAYELDDNGDVMDVNIIDHADDSIEIMMTEQLLALDRDRDTVSVQKEQTSLDIPDDERKLLYYILEDANFQDEPSLYIRREPYKGMYSSSAFAPFAHILLALKNRTKRKDAKRELHSAYFQGSLLFDGEDGSRIDFSQYFGVNDYWYYEMETGANLCVEIAAALLVLLKEKVIKDSDIPCLCAALKDCLCLVNQYPILIRIHLLRNCIQYVAAYMQAVRQHPISYIAHFDILKSPIKGNEGRTFNHPIEIEPSKKETYVKFTSEQLSWVFSEILHTIEIPFRPRIDAAVKTDREYGCIAERYTIPKEYPITIWEHPKCSLAFCNTTHRYIKEYIDYISSGTGHSKNLTIEKMFNQVHSTIFENQESAAATEEI